MATVQCVKTLGGQYIIQDGATSTSLLTINTSTSTITLAPTYTVVGTPETFQLTLPTITAIAGGAKIICVAPFAGTINGGKAAIDGAITATDITIALRINTNAVTNGSMTIANAGSAFGTAATCTPSDANTFVAGDILNATLTGGVGTVGGVLNIYVTRTS